MTMLAAISRRIRRTFRRRRGDEPPSEIARLSEQLGATCGGGLLVCPCLTGIITPVVNRYPGQTDVVALACTGCGEVVPLEEPGIFMSETETCASARATVH